MTVPNDRWDAALYDDRHAFVHQLGAGVVDLLAPRPGERILDLGCGTCPLTKRIADAGADVLGIDASPVMVGRARQAYPELRFEVADATTMTFDRPFDAIFSNAVLHWVNAPKTAAARMFAALRPGGRLVLEMGGHGNVATVLDAASEAVRYVRYDPFEAWSDVMPLLDINYFPTIGEYASVLEAKRFQVELAMVFDRPTPLDGGESGLRNWLQMFRPAAVEAIPPEQREVFFAAAEREARPALFRDGQWHADYRRLRVRAVRPLD